MLSSRRANVRRLTRAWHSGDLGTVARPATWGSGRSALVAILVGDRPRAFNPTNKYGGTLGRVVSVSPSDFGKERRNLIAAVKGILAQAPVEPGPEVEAVGLTESFTLRRELVGRVRDIDVAADEFVAVLSERGADEETEVIGRFSMGLLSSAERSRLEIGAAFHLVTGYRHITTTAGETLKSSLETKVLLRRAPPLSAAVAQAARTRARELRAEA